MSYGTGLYASRNLGQKKGSLKIVTSLCFSQKDKDAKNIKVFESFSERPLASFEMQVALYDKKKGV